MIFSSGYLHPQPHLHCLTAPPPGPDHLVPIWRAQAAVVPDHHLLTEVGVHDVKVDTDRVVVLGLQQSPLPVGGVEGLLAVSQNAPSHHHHGSVGTRGYDLCSKEVTEG